MFTNVNSSQVIYINIYLMYIINNRYMKLKYVYLGNTILINIIEF